MNGGNNMSIRIRHSGDKELYFGKSGWSLNPSDAREFTTPLEAVTFVVQRQIGHAELVARDDARIEVACQVT